MKVTLTASEIDYIENALINISHFTFDDLRLEVLDHIAIEIEEKMASEKKEFQEAFYEIMEKWNPLILPKTWSRYETVPYIVCQLWKKLDWKYYFMLIPLSLIGAYLISYFYKEGYDMKPYMLGLVCVGLSSAIFISYKKRFNKLRTVLSAYAYRKHSKLFFILFFLSCLVLTSESDTLYQNFVMLFMYLFNISILIARAFIMNKHTLIENNILKLK